MSQLQNEIRDVNVHQREEEGVWKPDGRSKSMNAETNTGGVYSTIILEIMRMI